MLGFRMYGSGSLVGYGAMAAGLKWAFSAVLGMRHTQKEGHKIR